MRWHQRLNLSFIAGAAPARTGDGAGSAHHDSRNLVRERQTRRRLVWAVAGSLALHVIVATELLRHAQFAAAPPEPKTPIQVYLASRPRAEPGAVQSLPVPELAQAHEVASSVDESVRTVPDPQRMELDRPPEPALARTAPELPSPPGDAPNEPGATAQSHAAGIELEVASSAMPAGAETGAEPTSESSIQSQAALRSLPLDPALERKLERRIGRQLEKSDAWILEPFRLHHGGRDYQVQAQRIAAPDASGFERAVAEIRTTRDGAELTATMEFERLAFSRFAQFVDRWDPELMLARDEIRGRFHVNSEINVLLERDQEPRLIGPVSVDAVNFEGKGRRNDVFQGGLKTRRQHADIAMARSIEVPPADAFAEVHHVDADATIELLAEGGYTIAPKTGAEAETRARSPGRPLYIVAAEGAGIDLRGTVRGVVVVYSPSRVGIIGNLRYATDPREEPQSPDYLGIVSANIVEVARPDATGPGDLEIFAAVYAARRFLVRRASASAARLLHIYGSLTAGSISATEPRFATLLEFDPRLEHRRLPYFPMSARFERSGAASGWLGLSAAGYAVALQDSNAQLLP